MPKAVWDLVVTRSLHEAPEERRAEAAADTCILTVNHTMLRASRDLCHQLQEELREQLTDLELFYKERGNLVGQKEYQDREYNIDEGKYSTGEQHS